MILGIDVGNTNIVIGALDKKNIYFTERLATDHNKTELEYAIFIKNLLDFRGISKEEIEGCILSSVVPPVNSALSGAVQRVIGKSVMVVGPGVKTGLNILIDDPATLGADMVVGAVAAKKYFQEKEAKGKPMIVIDMGTATTISVLDEKGSFLGGLITPGPRTSMMSLVSGTAMLPSISLTAPKKIVSSNTIDCMRSGIVYGQAALLDGVIERINEEQGKEHYVLATGGLATVIAPVCKHDIKLDGDLLLKGLALIYYKNA